VTKHTFTRPAEVTVTTGGGIDAVQLLAGLAACAAIAGAVWFAITYALILGLGMAAGCALIAAGVWYLHRRFAVVAYSPRERRPRVLRATAVVLPSPPAPQHAVPAQSAGAIGSPIPVPYVITDAIPQQRKQS
jgi:hypothetical protein